jgi:hypothetical protein
MQWQHGTFEKLTNGSLVLKPIKVDGRQLYSDPCQYKTAVFTRYNTTEKFKVRRTHPYTHLLSPSTFIHFLSSFICDRPCTD